MVLTPENPLTVFMFSILFIFALPMIFLLYYYLASNKLSLLVLGFLTAKKNETDQDLSEHRFQVEAITFSLRKVASAYLRDQLQGKGDTAIIDGDITEQVIDSGLFQSGRFTDNVIETLENLIIDDGFPKEGAKQRLFNTSGKEIKILVKNKEVFIKFTDGKKEHFEGVKYAIYS